MIPEIQRLHGRDCPKVQHVGSGYLHDAVDDRPYDVDGMTYCGRCHGWMESQFTSPAAQEEPPTPAWRVSREGNSGLAGTVIYRGEEVHAGIFSDDAEWFYVSSKYAQMVCDSLNATPSGHPPAQEAPPKSAALREAVEYVKTCVSQHPLPRDLDVQAALTELYRGPLATHPPAEAQADPPKPDRIEWQRGYQAGYAAGRKRVTLDPDEQRQLLCLFGGYLWIEQIALTQDALAAAVDAFVTLWSKDVPGSVAGADAPGPGGTVGDRGAGEGEGEPSA